MTQVFLSHSTLDGEFVDQLVADLRLAGIIVWKAPDSILPGEEWVRAIQRGLATSSHFVLVKSPNAVASAWVNFEFETALRQYHKQKMHIIPVFFEPCDEPLFWEGFHHVNVRDNYKRGLLQLIERLRDEQPDDPPPPALPETTIINVNIRGDVLGVVNVAGRDVLHHGPDAGRPVAPNAIKYRSVIKLIHEATHRALHSHNLNYEHPESSMQQQVTAFWGSDDNDYWIVKGRHNSPEEYKKGEEIRNGDIVRLEHRETRKNLHSHGNPAPVTKDQQEVTAYSPDNDGNGDSNDDWEVEIEGEGRDSYWTDTSTVRLIHMGTGAALHSHTTKLPRYGHFQQEVTCFPNRDDNDLWRAALLNE